ncbi:protein FAM219B [Carassius auratus]|uniref:Protein FAM219B n=1 Tax=Carassius auratus TaxID=7957 RepID=A0A6P6LNF3_CARAU|nr:protein FAM219B-like [Carassius auratus]
MSDATESREQRAPLSSAAMKRAEISDQPPAVEKRGPYLMFKAPGFHTTLQKHRDTARRALQKRGLGSGRTRHKRTDVRMRMSLNYMQTQIFTFMHLGRCFHANVSFSKGYAALSQTGEDSLVSLDSDSDAELDCSSGYSSAEVHPELSRQLLKDGYHLDEIPDDEDLDLIPPKALSSSVCCCSDAVSCCLQ